MKREYITINVDSRCTDGDTSYFISDDMLCYTTERYPEEVRFSEYTLEELLEVINTQGVKYWVTNRKVLNKYLMTRELLK